MIESEEGFVLSRDNDSHWYIIPVENISDWEDFLNIDPDDEASWDTPEWAEAVGGAPSLITFYKYQVN